MDDYVSLEFANAYIDPSPSAGNLWKVLTDAKKGEWITWAQQLVNNVPWVGSPVDLIQDETNQQFPRDLSEAWSSFNWSFANDGVQRLIKQDHKRIPESIRRAVCETIIGTITTGKFQTFVDMQAVNISEFQAGSAKFIFAGDKKPFPLPGKAWKLVSYLSRQFWDTTSIKLVGRV